MNIELGESADSSQALRDLSDFAISHPNLPTSWWYSALTIGRRSSSVVASHHKPIFDVARSTAVVRWNNPFAASSDVGRASRKRVMSSEEERSERVPTASVESLGLPKQNKVN